MTHSRVRFAPSPTGYLHVGGLRTALFNYLFAANTGGTAVLRIEDTDRNRIVKGAIENLQDSLAWSGIKFTEGFGIGGSYGPYLQSERLEIYREYAERLVTQGNAYYCFCTAEKLAAIRDEQRAQKRATPYNGLCRKLSPKEIKEKLHRNESYTIRLKIPSDRSEYHIRDRIRGDIRINSNQIDDQILIKSDGYPTYHLANVVDDHLMKITHVIRGEEWLPSTPKHVQLYEYFGWQMPQFAHLPLLLNPDRSKLSKRQGGVATEDYHVKGYLPEALINFVALLGWSTQQDREIYSMPELVEKFSLDQVGKSGAVFDTEKLKWMNQQYIQQKTPAELYPLVLPYLPDIAQDADKMTVVKILEIIRDRMTLLTDAADTIDLFFNDTPVLTDPELSARIQSDEAQRVYRAFIGEADREEELTSQNFGRLMKQVQKKTGVKGKTLYEPMRIAITLMEQGPDLSSVVEIFGKEKCLHMVRNVLIDT